MRFRPNPGSPTMFSILNTFLVSVLLSSLLDLSSGKSFPYIYMSLYLQWKWQFWWNSHLHQLYLWTWVWMVAWEKHKRDVNLNCHDPSLASLSPTSYSASWSVSQTSQSTQKQQLKMMSYFVSPYIWGHFFKLECPNIYSSPWWLANLF